MRLTLAILLLCVRVHGADINAASASLAHVQAAVDSATRGVDRVLVPAGSATWTGGTLSVTKGVEIIGDGIDSTVITSTGVMIAFNPDSTAIANEETIKLEGFTFDGNDSCLKFITFQGAGPSSTKPFKNLIIGYIKFQDSSTADPDMGVISLEGQQRGVIHNIIWDRCNVIVKNMGNNDTTEWSNGNFPFAFGSGDNLFVESCLVTNRSSFAGGNCGWVEVGQGARMVLRYSHWAMANADHDEILDAHGFQSWPGGNTGTMGVEMYGNTASNTDGYALLNHRGGQGLFFNNITTGDSGMAIDASQYDDGCEDDVPGSFVTIITNTYTLNNTHNGTIKNMGINLGGCSIAENVHFRNYNTMFNGTVGIGRGTAAPTGSCTKGVGYWQCSTATPTTDPAIVQTGTFWIATATDTWTAVYQPYEFPHPLRSEEGGEDPSISISATDSSASETGATGQFTLTASASFTGNVVIIVSGTAANGTDYSTISEVKAMSGTTATITVTPLNDTTGEEEETVIVTITSGSGYTVGSPNSATVTLSDDDKRSEKVRGRGVRFKGKVPFK